MKLSDKLWTEVKHNPFIDDELLAGYIPEVTKLEAVAEAAMEIFHHGKDYVADCNCSTCEKITGDLMKALEPLDTESTNG